MSPSQRTIMSTHIMISTIVTMCLRSFFTMALLSPSPIISRHQSHYRKIQEQSFSSSIPTYSSYTTLLSVTPVPISTAVTTTAQPLLTYFLETLISQGIPALFWIIVIAFAAKSFSARKGMNRDEDSLFGGNVVEELYDDLYTSESTNGGGGSMLSNLFQSLRRSKNTSAIKNLGIPSETYLTLTPLNPMYQSYEYTFTAATQSKAKAAAILRTKNFDQALQRAVDSSVIPLTSSEVVDLFTEEKAFLKQGKEIMNTIRSIQYKMTKQVIEQEMEAMDVRVGEVDPHPIAEEEEKKENKDTKKNQTDVSMSIPKLHDHRVSEMSWWKNTWNQFFPDKDTIAIEKLMTQLEEENSELLRLELEFIRSVVEIMGPDRANGIRAAILGNIQGGNAIAGTLFQSIQQRPLSTVLKALGYMASEDEKYSRKRLFVTDFIGDVTASQVDDLREEVTGILRSAKPGDEVLLILQTGGGTVTGYGLGAAQLERFKKLGIKLTICVEQVAASGGYLMSCVADKIIASPFAVLGSIGVVAEMPNVYDRLKREGIEFQTVTAGKYKRTLTPTKKVTKEDFDKEQQELEEVLTLFKNFVHRNRPSLDINAVATGETWFGEDALNRGLCDELRTVDDVLIEYIDGGYDVFQVRYNPPQQAQDTLSRLLPVGAYRSRKTPTVPINDNKSGFFSMIVRKFVSIVKEEIMSELDGGFAVNRDDGVKRKFMLHDGDVSQNIRSKV